MPPFVLCSAINDKALEQLKTMIGYSPTIADLRLRETTTATKSNAAYLRNREKRWVSDIENRVLELSNITIDSSEDPSAKPCTQGGLKLIRQPVTNAGCGLIVELIMKQSTLVDVSLQNCQITCAGAVILSNGLKLIRRLDLSNSDSEAYRGRAFENSICSVGVNALAHVLESNSAITHLSLSRNHVGESGAKALAKMLRKNSTLQCLNLSSSSLGGGVDDLLEAFKMSTSLKSLNLQWCRLRPGRGTQLAAIQAARNGASY